MSSGEGYAIGQVKEFQDPSNPGELNAMGKYFKRKDRMATGFTVLMLIIGGLVVVGVIYYGPRLFGRKVTVTKTPPPLPPRRMSSSLSDREM